MKVHHLGYLVANIDEAIKEFQDLGYTIEQKKFYDSSRRVFLCFLENNGLLVELVCPAKDCKLFSTLHKRIGNAPYHVCYILTPSPNFIKDFQEKGYHMVQQPEPALAFKGKEVAFFMNEAIGLIEVILDK